MAILRAAENPIITPKDIKPSRDDLEVLGVFNAGVTRLNNEVVLLLRVAERPIPQQDNIVSAAIYDTRKQEVVLKDFQKDDPQVDLSDPRLIITPSQTYLTSISHLRLARSTDDLSFQIDPTPAIAAQNGYETFGIEDPRISLINDTYHIDYVAVSPAGVTTCLISTRDFVRFERHGVIFCPDNKDVVIFPEKINGRYYALHRPASSLFKKNNVWIAESPDLLCWGNHAHLMAPDPAQWDSHKIGAGAVPFRTDAGWVEVYHGVDNRGRYCLGAVLLDGNEPSKVIARSVRPLMEPETEYECAGFFGNVVFTCGLLYEENKIRLYYGAADSYICYAEISVQQVLATLNL